MGATSAPRRVNREAEAREAPTEADRRTDHIGRSVTVLAACRLTGAVLPARSCMVRALRRARRVNALSVLRENEPDLA